MATKTARKSSPSKRRGLFNWETSYFGGVQKIVYDFPYIDVPSEVIFKHKTASYLTYFESKVLKIFILKVKEHCLEKWFAIHHKVVKMKKSFFDKEETSYRLIDKSAINICIKRIIDEDVDISSLFEDRIVIDLLLYNSDIYIELPSSDKQESSDDGLNNLVALLKKMMQNVCKSESTYNRRNGISNGKHKENLKFIKVVSNSRSLYYCSNQKKDAENLIRMLDVNYDKKQDKIDSLKCGKLSPQKIAEVPAGNMHIYHRIEEDQATKPFSVVILCDESGSMEGPLFDQQHSLVKTLYLTFSQIMPSEQIFVFGHAGGANPDVYIYQDKLNPGFEETFVSQLDRNLGENYDGPVIESIYERVRKQAPNDNILLITVSDGYPSGDRYGGPPAMKELHRIVEKCKRDSFVTVGIGIGDYDGVKSLYKYNTVIKYDGEDLVKNVSKVINIAVKTEFQ